MARQARIQFEGAIYHITFRGNDRKVIFRADSDRLGFLDRLEERVPVYQVRLFFFCLMSNHVHLVVQTPLANISAFMGSLLTAYSTYFNRRYRRSGHLTQGRFDSPVVEENVHLLQLSRYVHLNPVKTKAWDEKPVPEARAFLRAYPWSSYPSYIGKKSALGFLDYRFALDQVAPKSKNQKGAYRKYVEYGLIEEEDELEEAMSHSPVAIGSESFVEEIKTLHSEEAGKRLCREDAGYLVRGERFDAEDILKAVCAYYGMDHAGLRGFRKQDMMKPVASMLLMKYGGLSQRKIAPLVGVGTGAGVSTQIRKYREAKTDTMRDAAEEILEMLRHE